jgi:flagellar basal body-associated protein FliL
MARQTRNQSSNRSKSSAHKRTKNEGRTAFIKILSVIVVVVLVGGIYFTVSSSRRTLDATTSCPATVDSVTVLLVDVTDPMNTAQRQDFNNQLIKLKNSIPRYGQLIVTKVDATGEDLLRPIITRCNPGTAKDVSSSTGDPAAVQKQWETTFDKPLTDAFDGISKATGAGQSPILESVQSVSLTELQKPGLGGVHKRLIIASDLLQNTKDASFYRSLPEPEEFLSSSTYRRLRTDLRGVDVELWMLERTDAASTQPRALSQLWERIIGAEGGDVSRIYNVSG